MFGLVARATGWPLSQSPHWQVALHVWVPAPPPQLRALAAAHAPWPEHADHADQTPFWHVCVCVPQLPQACDADGSEQTQLPLWHVVPLAQVVQLGPQWVESLLVSRHAVPHIVKPWLHAQGAHAQLAVQVWEPLPSHACVLQAVHPLPPVQADHCDHVPFSHVRVCVPQAPHG